jgi:NADPH-dependent curcumin reductase CurA
MGLLNIIRRMALREKQSIREISRRTGLSRNTITKYLSAGTIEPTFTVKWREDIVDGLQNAPAAFIGLLEGRSFGKLVVRVSPEQ